MKARRESPVAYELVDHTADIGVEVTGRDLSDILAVAGMALADLIYDPDRVEEKETLEVRLEAPSEEELLLRWLNELIYLREVRGFLWRSLEVEAEAGARLRATLRGEVYRPDRHRFRTGLKAATYHQLRIQRSPGGLRARIIFDA